MTYEIRQGDALHVLRTMDAESVQCVVTSPPYWGLRDYGVEGQIGLEGSLAEYVSALLEVFHEVRRVLRDDGTLWLNLGDCYVAGGCGGDTGMSGLEGSTGHQDQSKMAKMALGYGPRIGIRSSFRRDRVPRQDKPHKTTPGLKPKDLVGQPWRLAFALQADGWWLRSDIIWHKPNPMPESVTDRPTKAHEYLFLLSKSERYFYDADAIKERMTAPEASHHGMIGHYARPSAKLNGKTNALPDQQNRNKRTVWTIATEAYSGSHFATFPQALVEPCVLAGCPHGGVVLDPFCGSGTAGVVAIRHGRRFVGIELNPKYVEMAHRRIHESVGLLAMAE